VKAQSIKTREPCCDTSEIEGSGMMEKQIEEQQAPPAETATAPADRLVGEIVSPCRRAPDLGPWWPPRNARDVEELRAAGMAVSLADIDLEAWSEFELSMSESDFGCLLCPDAGDPTVEASKLSDSGV